MHLLQGDDIDADLARLDEIGGPHHHAALPARLGDGVGNTPFRLYKINTHQGGHSVPFCFSWPAGLDERGEFRRQYEHVTDLLPTLLEIVGVERPDDALRRRARAARRAASFAAVLADADAPGTHREHVFECNGHRGLYRDGWQRSRCTTPLTPFTDEKWELYDLEADPTELHNLAAEQPERVAELADAWESRGVGEPDLPARRGQQHQVRAAARARRRSTREPVTIPRGTPTLERWRSVQLIWFRGFTVTVELDHRAGDEGMLFAHGDQGVGLPRSTCSTASCSSCTTTVAGT